MNFKIFIFLIFVKLTAEEIDFWSVVSSENEPSLFIDGKVNAITGTWCVQEQDLVIQGKEPIIISRSFLNDSHEWAIAPFIHVEEMRHHKITITEKSGAKIRYRMTQETSQIDQETFTHYKPCNLDVGYTNTSRGEISSRTNLNNNLLLVDDKHKIFILCCADGTEKTYRKIHKGNGAYKPISEHLPNGNRVLYEYEEIPLDKEGNNKQINLKSIRTTNPTQTIVFAQANFIYEDPKRKNPHFFIVGSDGSHVEYCYSTGKDLTKVISSTNLVKNYDYNSVRLSKVHLPLGRLIQAEYYNYGLEIVHGQKIEIKDIITDADRLEPSWIPDPRLGKVKMICAPVGDDSSIKATHSIIYDLANRKTTVYEIDDQRKEYVWDSSNRIQKIVHFDNQGAILNTHQFVWSQKGNLLCNSILDAEGNPERAKRYTYDEKGNVLEVRLFGNLSGIGSALRLDANGLLVENGVESSARYFKYYEGKFSLLKSEEDDQEKRIEYTYLEGTDLPTSQLTYDRHILKKRKYWHYNQDGLLIQETVDDGMSGLENDFRGVTERRALSFTLNKDGPYVGLPNVIEEKFFEQGSEHLLQKCVLSYTTGARISQKDYYDADGVFRYRLTYQYDSCGRLIEESDPIGRVQKFAYDECGNKIFHHHFSGRVNSYFTYNAANLCTRAYQMGDDQVEIEECYEYDHKNRLVLEKKPLGQYVRYAYDSQGCVQSKKYPPLKRGQNEVCFSYTYDSLGRMIQEIDPKHHVTKRKYSACNQPIYIEYPDQSSDCYVYNLDGKLQRFIDAEGIETAFFYDAFGRVLSKTISCSGENLSTESIEYNSFHETLKIDPEGNRTSYQYDGAGRLVSETLDHECTSYKYDSLGRCYFEAKGDCSKIKEFNLLNQILEEREENLQGKRLHRVRYAYDAAGNVSSMIRNIQGKEAIETTIYDSIARPIQKIDAMGFSTFISYQTNPYLQETVTDPSGLVTIKQYNAQKKVERLEIKSSKGILLKEECEYDDRGNVTEERSYNFSPIPRLIITQKTYNWNGSLTTLIEAAGTTDEKISHYQYDFKGRLKQTIKPDGLALTYAYSPLGWLSSLISSDGSIQYDFTYDRLGRSVASSDRILNQTTKKQYDAHGRLLQERLGTGFSIESDYDSMGRRKEVRLFDGSRVQYQYNAKNLTEVKRITSQGTESYKHVYGSYDLSGNVLQEHLIGDLGTIQHRFNAKQEHDACISSYMTHEIIERDCLGNILKSQLNEAIFCYTYDDLSQISSESGDIVHDYLHDAHHALVQKDGEVYENNALLQISSHLRYDQRGNPIQQGDLEFQYDALDRLIAFQSPQLRATYTYDAEHRRLSKTLFTLQDGFWKQTDEQRFLYDGQNEIGSVDPSGQIIELRILGRTPHAEIGSAIAIEICQEIYAPLYDLQNNIVSLISLKTRKENGFSQFSAFGEEKRSEPAFNPWRFSSKRVDEESGFVYFGRRYYCPKLGRWLNPDPAGHMDGINRYAYVKNNPLTHLDLYGLFSNEIASSVHFQDYLQDSSSNWNFDSSSPLVCVGEPDAGTIHYHCGINNSLSEMQISVQTAFEKLGKKHTIWGHWIHEEGLLKGFAYVGLEKFTEKRSSAFEFVKGIFTGSIEVLASMYLSHFSDIGKAIRNETKLIGDFANQIIEQGNPRLKQVHHAFSNAGYILNEALSRLTAEQRNTVIMITAGSTKWIEPKMAHKVFNLCGDKDRASVIANGGNSCFEKAEGRKLVQIVPQGETRPCIGGHYNIQPDYQDRIKWIIDKQICGIYEIY